MISSRWRAALWKRSVPGCHACGLVIAWCMGHAMLSPPAAAQAQASSREELMRKWDIDRDGKVDASEAEIARGRMRAPAVFAFVCAPGRAVYALRRIIHPNARVRREALAIAGAIALRQRLLRALLARIGVPTELYARLGVATLSQQ